MSRSASPTPPPPAWRRPVLVLLVAVAVVAAGVAVATVWTATAEGGPIERVQALREPAADPGVEREELLGVAGDFVRRFNTYGPDLLADDGTMPEYAGLTSTMTARFGGVFESNVGYAEQTVAQLSIRRRADVYAVGIAAQDDDSAELLVAGVATFSYPDPDKKKAWIEFDPERFRYQVSLVRQHGEWLVDDLDDVDDDLPPLAQSSPQSGAGLPGGLPTGEPTPEPSSEPSPGKGATQEGDR
ncbi:hypothetical protein [Nocardioides sp. YIM 152588]|uniref:hypothetical protein n=1 Tax=Nocardioides sp. YIM 152588 TaxID=3158259 RepID=UPI0032E4585A